MRKLFVLAAALLVSMTGFAQMSIGDVTTVNYYGVDFSKVKTFGTDESGYQFQTAFEAINNVIIGEWGKYKPDKYLRKTVAVQDISVTQENNRNLNPDQLPTTDGNYRLSEQDIKDVLKSLQLKESEGVGLVILGELLNKQANQGHYVVVFFDIPTREIIYSRSLAGKSKGFGLRNYWARPVYEILKKWRY